MLVCCINHWATRCAYYQMLLYDSITPFTKLLFNVDKAACFLRLILYLLIYLLLYIQALVPILGLSQGLGINTTQGCSNYLISPGQRELKDVAMFFKY